MKSVPVEPGRTILLYSPDIDFCLCLRLFFQEKYSMVTITDPNMLLMMVRSLKPDLVIADTIPTDKMKHRFEIIKREHPDIRIMLFYVSRFEPLSMTLPETSVDAVFFKPIDLGDVTRKLEELLPVGQPTRSQHAD